ncbi:hypothetical protein CEUSTIGMA_g4264.t1 [Chlamydomonas eustigma]|uniref:CNH domain-containing protein n=1 Tax=Chlamydomonas eustigma TaxID=1157962 RepID=A0A250X164_9CHLO|nr:hypothetical protein CEUSTIGMA_g4264.t1 [Chlamydomonas eustigma]|eukprot:GAX76818.1 hypothetical protein CEUSTIGMA_g4264.t1 [Chlamydomonas eustigma]
MFEAYRVEPVIDGLGRRIEAIHTWDEHLLVALSDGGVLLLQQKLEGSVVDDKAKPVWQVVKAHRSVDKRPLKQIEPLIGAKSMLLGLSEEGINLYALPTMLLKFQALGTRGASCFAWNQSCNLLAVAVRRRLLFFSLSGSDLLPKGESALPEPALTMIWAGRRSLFVGCKKTYLLQQLGDNGTLIGLLPVEIASSGATSSGAAASPCMASTAPAIMAAASTVEAISRDAVGKAENAAVLPVLESGSSGSHGTSPESSGREVLIACGSSVFFFGEDGKPSKKAPIVFSEPLLYISCGSHYLVGIMTSGAVQAQSLLRVDRERAVQTFDLGVNIITSEYSGCDVASSKAAIAASALSSGWLGGPAATAVSLTPSSMPTDILAVQHLTTGMVSHFVAIGDFGVRQLVPVPLQDQAVTLAAQGDFHQALALVTLIPEEQQQQGEAPPENSEKQAGTGSDQSSSSESGEKLLHMPTSSRGDLEGQLRLMYGHHLFAFGHYDEGMAQMAMAGSGAGPLLLLRLFPSLVSEQDRRYIPCLEGSMSLPTVEEPPRETKAAAVSALLPYLLSHRTRALNRPDDEGRHADGKISHDMKSASTAADNLLGSAEPSGFQIVPSKKELLRMLDTAIVKIMVLMPDTGALLRFVQSPNHIGLEDAKAVLTQHGMYAELAALYRANAQHSEGLELLRKLSQEPGKLDVPARGAAADLPGLPGVWAAVRYLVSLTEEEAALIRNHSSWILGADPEAGLQAFLQMQPPLSPALVLSILGDDNPNLSALYLEAALHMGLALPQEYHNELLLIYLQELQQQQAKLGYMQSKQLELDEELNPIPGQSLPQLLATAGPAADDHKLFPDDFETAGLTVHSSIASSAGSTPSALLAGNRGVATTTSAFSRGSGRSGGSGLGRATGGSSPPVGTSPLRPAASISAESAQARREPEDLYRRLRDLACSSPWIDPEYILTKLPPGQLIEVESLMLERLGRYPEALTRLVQGLGDLRLAEAMCDRIYNQHSKEASTEMDPTKVVTFLHPSEIYLVLLDVVVESVEDCQPPFDATDRKDGDKEVTSSQRKCLPPQLGRIQKKNKESHVRCLGAASSTHDRWQELAWLLSRKRTIMNPLDLLSRLPDAVSLADLLPLVGGGMLSYASEARRGMEVALQLRQAERLAAREDTTVERRRHVVHSPDRACCKCFRRIGNTVVVAYSDQSLAHYLCHNSDFDGNDMGRMKHI